MKHPGGIEAAQFLLGQRYIEAYSKLGREDNTIIIPAEPVKVAEQVSKSLNLMQKPHGIPVLSDNPT